jgi:hypothetical protein
VGRLTGVGPVRDGVGTPGQVALEHPAHGVGAAPGQLGDLGGGMALGIQQDHLVAGAGLGIAGGLVAAFQLGPGGRIQPQAKRRRRHARLPHDQKPA